MKIFGSLSQAFVTRGKIGRIDDENDAFQILSIGYGIEGMVAKLSVSWCVDE